MRILVTGATGLVGGHLLWHLLQQNDNIVALRRSSSNLTPLRTIFSFYTDNPDKYLDRIVWQIADINDRNTLREAMNYVQEIYHCAAIVSLGGGGDKLMDTNVSGTRNMVELALELQVNKFCFVSSIAACGFADKGEIITEETSWEQSDHKSMYAISKYNAEQEVWKGIQKGLNAVIVNPGVILGVSGANTGSSMIFDRAKKGMMFYTLGGSGYVDVQDVVKVMILLMESNITAERFILVGENNSNKEILTMMAKGFNKPRPLFNVSRKFLTLIGFMAEMAGKVVGFTPIIDRSLAVSATNRSYYSSQKVTDTLGYRFNPVSKCIGEVCAFMLKN
jgi:dihydroflavonol-4-reductase